MSSPHNACTAERGVAGSIEGCSLKSTKPNHAWNVYQHENGAWADQEYSKYSDTAVALRKNGFGAYRMSISWSRVLSYSKGPRGELVRPSNPAAA